MGFYCDCPEWVINSGRTTGCPMSSKTWVGLTRTLDALYRDFRLKSPIISAENVGRKCRPNTVGDFPRQCSSGLSANIRIFGRQRSFRWAARCSSSPGSGWAPCHLPVLGQVETCPLHILQQQSLFEVLCLSDIVTTVICGYSDTFPTGLNQSAAQLTEVAALTVHFIYSIRISSATATPLSC